MAKYVDLSADVKLSMTEILGKKIDDETEEEGAENDSCENV